MNDVVPWFLLRVPGGRNPENQDSALGNCSAMSPLDAGGPLLHTVESWKCRSCVFATDADPSPKPGFLNFSSVLFPALFRVSLVLVFLRHVDIAIT